MSSGIKFSQLPTTTTLLGQELIPILQSNLNRLTTIDALTGAVGEYALKNTSLIRSMSAYLLGEIRDNDTLIDILSAYGLDNRNLIDTKIYQLSSWVDNEFTIFDQQVDQDLDQLRTEIQSVSSNAGAPVFIVGVDNTLGLEQLVYQSDTVPANHIVTSATVDDDSAVRVTMEWDGPPAEWMGEAYINEQLVNTNDIARIGNTRRFTATKTLDLQGAKEIVARVNNQTYTVPVSTLGAGPEILNVTFGPPPTVNGFTPTYFLEGDQVQVTVQFDTSDVSSVTLYSGSSYATESVVDQPISTIGSPPSATFVATIDTTNSATTQLPLRISAKNSFGTKGAEHVSIATIPCKAGPSITNITFGNIPTTNGYTPAYFMDGDNVQVTAEFDNANVSNVKSVGGTSYALLANNSISVTTIGTPPSAVFTGVIDTNSQSIINNVARLAARSDKQILGVETNSATTIPVKYGPDITNISIGGPPVTNGYQPTFYMHNDPINIVVELDTANVLLVGRGGDVNGSVLEAAYLNVTTTGSPPSASFTANIETSDLTLTNRYIQLNAQGPGNRSGSYSTYPDAIPVKRGPDITNVSFGVYPGIQTELKDDDTIDMTVEYDTNNVVQTQVIGGTTYAGKSETLNSIVTNLSATMTLTIDTAVDYPHYQPVRLRARGGTTNNRYGNYHDSAATLTLNNVYPRYTGWNVIYPNTQTALKQGDTATVRLTIIDAGNTPTVAYTSPGSQLTITDPNVSSINKTVTCNSVGTVNETTNNYSVTVNRRENDATSSYSNVVYIADTNPVMSIDAIPTMRSGGSHGTTAQNYTITARSDQYLSYYDMDATANAGTIGNWSNTSQNKVWSAQMTVNDTDDKGNYPWVNITATNRAGIVVNTITTNPTYDLEGFVERTITIPSLSRTVSIGTNVFDVSNLVASETFRGTMTFDSTIANGTTLDPSLDSGVDVTGKFTIVDSSNLNVVDYNGDTFFNLDKTAAANNVSGTSQLTIEETV